MSNREVVIIDYGAGNLRSVFNAIARVGYKPVILNKPEDVLKGRIIVLPGVGAAADTMRSLSATGMDRVVRQVIAEKRPLFGVCMGLQVMLEVSEEGGRHKCLGIIPGTVRKLTGVNKIPHMGWNQVKQKMQHPIFKNIPDETSFYFVHSYYPDPSDKAVVAGTTDYGVTFCCAVVKDNLLATQFHPEKSGEYGLQMYANFLETFKC